MAWYYIIAIIVGCIILMYFTCLFVYVHIAKNMDGINLLNIEQDEILFKGRMLNVKRTLENIRVFSIFAGFFFPIVYSIIILYFIIEFLNKITSHITNSIINKNKGDKNENN